MADIFISHAHEDEERIQHLAQALEGQGFSVLWDRHIPAGQTWHSYIGEALRDASCVIVAWSNYSIDSNWVIEEAEEGKKRGVLIPVLLDSVEPPIGFRSIQAANLTDCQKRRDSPHFEQLLHDLNFALETIPTRSLTESIPEPKHDTSGLLHEPLERKLKAPSRHLAYVLMVMTLVLVVGGGFWGYQTWFPKTRQTGAPTPHRVQTVRVQIGPAIMSGFFTPKGYIATLKSFVKDAEELTVVWVSKNKEYRGVARIVPQRTALAPQVAFLKLIDISPPQRELPVRLSNSLAPSEEITRYLGPNDVAPGKVLEVGVDMTVRGETILNTLVTTEILSRGDSGAPVVDMEGRVVAMALFNVSESRSISIPIEDIKASFVQSFQ